MIPVVVVGAGSLGIAIGLALASVLDHLDWRLAERRHRRRARRRNGYVGVRRSVR